MVTNITCDKRIFIMTHYSNTPTPSFIFNNFLKTIFNQGAVFFFSTVGGMWRDYVVQYV